MGDLIDILKFEGKEISQLFQKASIEGKGTPQEVSDRREKVLIDFIKKFFPFPFRVTKGNIVDSYGHRSASIDCLILNPSHPYTTTDDNKYSIILADAVDSAIELKPDLNSDKEIERGLKQIVSVKNLKRQRDALIFKNKHSQEYQNTCKQIPCFIFCDNTYDDILLLLDKIVTYYEVNKITREFQFDYIVVNNRCLIANSKKDSYCSFKGFEEQSIVILSLGDLTLASFLFYLNDLPKSEPEISESFLKHYLTIKPENMETSDGINLRLRAIN